MSTYPLAIYTADHGLAWTYPESEISYSALDACRKAFGQLPDFNSGVPGIEGVWATEQYVFVLRCQSVKAWDFRGRDATYLAVTWVKRDACYAIDIEQLLASDALSVPTKNPPKFFNLEARPPLRMAPLREQPASVFTLEDGFVRVAGFVAGLPPSISFKALRNIGEGRVQCALVRPVPRPTTYMPQPPQPEIVPVVQETLHPIQRHGWPTLTVLVLLSLTFVLGMMVGVYAEAKLHLSADSKASCLVRDEESAQEASPTSKKATKTLEREATETLPPQQVPVTRPEASTQQPPTRPSAVTPPPEETSAPAQEEALPPSEELSLGAPAEVTPPAEVQNLPKSL